MGKMAFAIINALPTRLGGAAAFVSMFYATIWPKEAGRIITELSPDTVRVYAAVGLAVAILYWMVWYWLKPKGPQDGADKPNKPDTPGGNTYNQQSFGSGDNTMNF